MCKELDKIKKIVEHAKAIRELMGGINSYSVEVKKKEIMVMSERKLDGFKFEYTFTNERGIDFFSTKEIIDNEAVEIIVAIFSDR